MMLVYLDESGMGDPKKEPNVVVAGVIIRSDYQWRKVTDTLKDLVKAHIHEEDQEGFIFHASEQFNGAGRTPKNKYTEDQRLQMVYDLLTLPAMFELPIVHTFLNREVVKKHEGRPIQQKEAIAAQGISAMVCTLAVEQFARTYATPMEHALMVYENNNECREHVKNVQKQLSKPSSAPIISEGESVELKRLLPLKRVIDTAHFADKDEATILQVADAIAYVINKGLQDNNEIGRFVFMFQNEMIMSGKSKWSVREGLFGKGK